jgi:hypothetical protein
MMSCRKLFVFSFIALFLAGCGSAPKTPDMLVENANSKGMFSEKESFEVGKPLAQVSDLLRKKSHECFDQSISFVAHGDSSGGIRMDRRETRQITSKVAADRQHTRLTLQVKSTGGSTDLGDIPPDGWYFMVVDATPEGKNKTRVETYYQHTQFHGAFTVIKPWLTGTGAGCPDLTQ